MKQRKARPVTPQTAIEIAEETRRQIRARTEAIRRAKCEAYGQPYEPPQERKLQVVVPEADIILQPEEVENPFWNRPQDGETTNPRKITAIRNIKESPIALMAAKKQLDSYHLEAASKFRSAYEALVGSGAGSFDYSREPVDGGGARDPITERQLVAGHTLKEARQLLGVRAYAVVSKVAGEGVYIKDMASTHKERVTIGEYLRHALSDLAELWGYKTRKRA
jgi:hypothetical protein